MKFSVSEISKLTGVSIRTLHYYDQINLLTPSIVSEAGYRYYDDLAVEKLQQILFYKELDFSLKEISKIMNSSEYKKEDALIRQRNLLNLKRERLDKLIGLLDAKIGGDDTMSFKEFDVKEIEEAKTKYAEEVKAKWGNTAAYAQSKEKTDKYTKGNWKHITNKTNEIMKKFSENVGKPPQSKEVQDLVEEWRNFITESYYDCTNEILSGLGQMYVMDERFRKNIDKFGEGTAELISNAIKIYTEK